MATQGAVARAAMKARWSVESVIDWAAYAGRKRRFEAATRGGTVHRIETPIGDRTRHVFQIGPHGEVLTTFQMDQRWRIVSRLYPERLTSLLDIGCCRGWFVVQAAMRPECEKATGIDVVQGFIDAANDAKRILHLDKVDFHYAFLDDLINDPVKYRTPYQTIVLLNTYHYMFFGSGYSDRHWADHDFLLGNLARMCNDRIIFMSPLEVAECPSDITKRAAEHPEWAAQYTEERFLEVASKYFDVTLESHLGVRPLFLMRKKHP